MLRTRPLLALACILAPAARAQVALLRVDGAGTNHFIGAEVSDLGDTDGDGRDDILVFGRWDLPGQPPYFGAHIVSGATGERLVALLPGAGGARVDAALGGITGIDDIDGDGVRDVALGSFLLDEPGHVWIHSGADGSFLRDLSPGDAIDLFGRDVDDAGDVDGDGVGDVLVGAPGSNFADAHAYVFSGATGRMLHRLSPEDPRMAFGGEVAGVGDVDGDGRSDVAVAFGGQALTKVYSGATGRPIRSIPLRGYSVAGAGDVDGDGHADLVIGDPFDDTFDHLAGAARVVSGASGVVLRTYLGSWTSDRLGIEVDGAGDVDRDGYEDIVLGADGAGVSPTHGDAYVYSGRTGELIFKASDLSIPGSRNLGWAVSAAGDVNGDGLADVLVGDRYDQTHGVQSGSAHVLTWRDDGLVLEFDTEDDRTTPLVNGQHIDPREEFGDLLTIEGSGAGNFGAAIFDTDVLGPNAAGRDPDLLIGRGHALVLQEDPAQTLPGVFDFPDDAYLGGTLSLLFTSPTEPLSVRLVDIEAGAPAQDATVVLTDVLRRSRTFHVPGGWTADGMADPVRASRVLRLGTLAPQPGHGAAATALEDAGFDLAAVVRMDVTLSGSGAVDDVFLVLGRSPLVPRRR